MTHCKVKRKCFLIDISSYYRVLPDLSDLNCERYIKKVNSRISKLEDYNSHNTGRLDIENIRYEEATIEVTFYSSYCADKE